MGAVRVGRTGRDGDSSRVRPPGVLASARRDVGYRFGKRRRIRCWARAGAAVTGVGGCRSFAMSAGRSIPCPMRNIVASAVRRGFDFFVLRSE